MSIEQLEYRWHQLMRRRKAPALLVIPLWREILTAYTAKDRYYHTLKHLADLFVQADHYQDYIKDFDTLELSIWYHDIIYQCLRKDNEEKSAIFAKYRLEAIKYPRDELVKCYQQINATKTHELSSETDTDTAWLLDFDLSILGSPWSRYKDYANQIRREYAIFPTFLYKRGRRKVLKAFLAQERIFKTDTYYDLWEQHARDNMSRELKIIG